MASSRPAASVVKPESCLRVPLPHRTISSSVAAGEPIHEKPITPSALLSMSARNAGAEELAGYHLQPRTLRTGVSWTSMGGEGALPTNPLRTQHNILYAPARRVYTAHGAVA